MDEAIENNELSQERRNMLKGAGVLGLGALAGGAAATMAGASQVFAADMSHHHHGETGTKNKAMLDATYDCIQTGHECIAHCIELIKAGDTSIVDCMASVQETIAFCTAHVAISTGNSKYLNEMCELAIKICGDCQKQCEKHSKHPQCKACGEACAACVRECKKHLKV